MNTTRKPLTDDLTAIEQALQAALTPVKPRPAFVQRLDQQLRTAPPDKVEPRHHIFRKDTGKYTLIGLAGIFSVLMLVSGGIRAAAAMAGALGLISELRKQVKAEEPSSAMPAA